MVGTIHKTRREGGTKKQRGVGGVGSGARTENVPIFRGIYRAKYYGGW